MSIEENRELINNKKSESIDCFGLTKKKQNCEGENQVTPYDSFYLEDSLRIISAHAKLSKIKTALSSRLDENTGLYSVTVGDVNSEYYNFATMFNRMSNPVYAQRIWRSVALLEGIIKNIQKDYLQDIEHAVSQHSFNESMNQEENKHL